MEHIALAPAAIAAPVSVAEHIAPFLQWSQRLCLLGVHAGAIPDAPLQRRSLPRSKCMRRASLPALEKYELVERLVRALELGQFLEEYEVSRDALVLSARRLTQHLDAIGDRWLHVARIKPLCALQAAGLVARGELQQMNDSATSQLDGMRASRDDHVEAHRQQEVRRWTSVLGVVHTEVLGQLGLAHTDPEHCFDKVLGRTFARCCSVGEHVAECWPRELSGLEDKSDHIDRVVMGWCCVKADVPVQLVARVAGQLGSASPRRPDPGD